MNHIVVIGASGGIGRQLATMLPDKVYRTTHISLTGTAGGIKLDITDPISVQEFASWADRMLGDKIVVVNASGLNKNGVVHKLEDGDWDVVMDVNLRGPFLLCKHLVPVMKRRKWGRIIMLSSVVGSHGVVGTAAYAASKAGLEGLVRAVASEVGRYGITINALRLGYFDAGMIADVPTEMLDGLKKTIPAGELGDVRSIARAVEFLIGAGYVNGSAITIDGGIG